MAGLSAGTLTSPLASFKWKSCGCAEPSRLTTIESWSPGATTTMGTSQQGALPAGHFPASSCAATPPGTLNLLLKRSAWAVVRPQIRGELLELIEFATKNGVPIVPRGSGTSGYGGAVPTEGGVVVDMRAFNKVLKVDKGERTILCEANATFAQLEEVLRANGLALRQYPTSFHAGTVAGWL